MSTELDSRKALLEGTTANVNESGGNLELRENEREKARQARELAQEEIDNLKSNRDLKIEIKDRVLKIVCLSMWFTIVLISINTVLLTIGKPHYSEVFLGVLLGSQLLILPFSLLYVITNHLFPFKDNSNLNK